MRCSCTFTRASCSFSVSSLFFMRCCCTFSGAGCSFSVFQPVFFLARAFCVLLAICTALLHGFVTQYCTFFAPHCCTPLYNTVLRLFLHHIAALLQHYCNTILQTVDLQPVSKCGPEGPRKAKFPPSDYQQLTAACGFLVYFILCHTLLISKLHFCLSVRSERGCSGIATINCSGSASMHCNRRATMDCNCSQKS